MEDRRDHRERFEIREELARDPRFVRYRAFDRHLETEVLLEQPGEAVRERLATSSGDKAMREARMLARVQHPRVIRLREVAEVGGLPTLVLDPSDGERLDRLLDREGVLDPAQVIRIGRDLAQAAQAVHSQGVVHRGIAPENVLVDAAAGGAVLAGFTFAKPIDVRVGQSSLNHRGRLDGGAAVQGLPEYAAPEQLAGQPADHRADVFSLGCLLYRCATGRDAFPSDAVTYEPPPAPRCVVAGVPRGLSDLILRCLAHSPIARFPNMLAVDERLAALEAKPSGGSGRSWTLAALGGALVAIVSVAWAVGWPVPGAGDVPYRGPDRPVMKGGRPNEPVHGTGFAGRRALLVGCDYVGSPHHDARRLHNAERDVEALQGRLERLDWAVRPLVGSKATEAEIRAGLNWLVNDSTRDDQILIYLAGHGELDEVNPDFGSFVPFDGGPAEGGNELRGSRWIPFSLVTRFLGAHGPTAPKHVFVLVDTCHAGASSTTRGRPPRESAPEVEIGHATRDHVRRKAHVLLASARAHEQATDGNSDHSPFAQGVLEALDRVLAGEVQTSGHVYMSVYDALERADAAQVPTPRRYTGDGVEFIFLPRR